MPLVNQHSLDQLNNISNQLKHVKTHSIFGGPTHYGPTLKHVDYANQLWDDNISNRKIQSYEGYMANRYKEQGFKPTKSGGKMQEL